MGLHLSYPQQVGSHCGRPEDELISLSHCPAHSSSCWTVTCWVKSEFLKHHSSVIFIFGDFKALLLQMYSNFVWKCGFADFWPYNRPPEFNCVMLELTRHYFFPLLTDGKTNCDPCRQGASNCLCSSLSWISLGRLCAYEQGIMVTSLVAFWKKGLHKCFNRQMLVGYLLMKDTQEWSGKPIA